MCFYYDYHADVYQNSRPKARKAHVCCECGGAIVPGETYLRNFQVYEGEYLTFKVCLRCEAVRDLIASVEVLRGCHGDEALCPFGGLVDAIYDDEDHYGLMDRDHPDGIDRVRPEVAHLFPKAVARNREP